MNTRFCMLLLLLLWASSQALSDTNWTDRKEYDLVLTIRSETTPQKRLDLLNRWTKQYPKTGLREARLELYLETYQSMGDAAHMFQVSKEILSDHPGNPVGLYWCAILLPDLPSASPDALSAGEKAARGLLSGLDSYFKDDRKPPSVSEADWKKQATATAALAHRSLGWVSWQRGDLAPAEDELQKSLQQDPHDAEASAWLGIVLSLENGKQSAALWQLARASNVEPGAGLPEEQRRQVSTMLEHVYASFHGGLDGLDDLRKASASSAFPVAGFSIDSATTVAARRAEAELSLTNPELAAWLAIRRQLQAADGQQYFAANLQSKAIPMLKGTVIRCTPARSPREFEIAMSEGDSPAVTLKLTSALPKYTGPGSKIMFRGTAESFNADPFNLVITADPSDIQPDLAKPPKVTR